MTSRQKCLEDRTPYMGQLGELAYDPEEDKVQCQLCGGWYRARHAATTWRRAMLAAGRGCM